MSIVLVVHHQQLVLGRVGQLQVLLLLWIPLVELVVLAEGLQNFRIDS